MNRKKLQWLLCVIGCLGILAVVLTAVLLHQTDKKGHDMVTFSQPSGFYDDPFSLEMKGSGKIYYTLDSSDPDENSIPYTGPIEIRDATPNENVYSMITDVSLDFNRELLEKAGSKLNMGYRVPQEPVDKCTVVRAVTIDEKGNKSKTATAVYFVGFEEKTGYRGINIASIVTDPKNLFDYETGIYVTGKTFDDSLVDGEVVTANKNNFGVWPANYRKKGLEWEREAYVCFFDEDRSVTLSGQYGIRIQGGSSRGLLPKNLNIFARSDYGDETISAVNLFGEPWKLSSVNFQAGAQGMETKIQDYMINTLAKDMKVFTREYEPYEVFLDGEYWGVYWLSPRMKKDYVREKYNYYDTNTVYYKAGAIEIGESTDINLYKSLMKFVSDNDMTDPELYAQACELFDVESCVDYYALEIYVANLDWPHHNKAMIRTRETQNSEYADGKWRWVIHDVNMALFNEHEKTDFVQWAINRDPMFASLMENEGFADAIYDKLEELAEGMFEPERMREFVTDYELAMSDAMENEYLRFYGGNKTAEDFHNNCQLLIRFFNVRHDTILQQCEARKQ